MSSQPLVSVVIPTYNRARLLPRAIQSVLSQDFADLELIVIDDGSTDETTHVLAQIRDSRLRCVHLQQNGGVWAARRQGVSESRADFVGLMDSDDVWLPGKLAHQMAIFARHSHIDLLFGDFQNINYLVGTTESGFRETQRGLSELRTNELEHGVFAIVAGMPQALLMGNFIATPSVVLRRSAFARAGNFQGHLKGAGDLEFWWRASLRGVAFAYTTRMLMERHKDQSSITARALTFSPIFLTALDLCESTAREAGRLDLVPKLNLARHGAWRSLVHANALLGNRPRACAAFLQSLHYGFSLRACAYLAAALAGPSAIALGKRLRGSTPKLIPAR